MKKTEKAPKEKKGFVRRFVKTTVISTVSFVAGAIAVTIFNDRAAR